MRIGSTNRLIFVALSAVVWISDASLAQDSVVNRPKRRTFGFSLRDLNPAKEKGKSKTHKHDPAKSALPETSDDVVKVETLLAVFDLLVTDSHGKPVETLNKSDFTVSEDGIQQTVTQFTKGDETQDGRSIVLVLEWSNTAHYVEKSLEAAQTFIEKLRPQDYVAVVTTDIKLVCDFTNNKEKLRSVLHTLKNRLSRGPEPSLPAESVLPKEQFEFETLIAVLQELLDSPGRHIIIFQADGGEVLYLRDQALANSPVPPPVRKISLANVLSVVTGSRSTTIYSVIPDYQYLGLTPEEQMNRARESMKDQVRYLPESQQHLFFNPSRLRNIIDSAVLAQTSLMSVSQLSGGWSAYLERPDRAEYIYSQILADANQRYVLAYPIIDKTRDGRVRSVSIRVQGHPEYHIQARQSYALR